ncbi:hypothetical protein AX17_006466 [Amanita inopinata Kibby_2008]|nr:hypothetical protein AX17_006466 [Amanita inopinata Kibby_2008]
MKRAPPNAVPLAEPPQNKKIRTIDPSTAVRNSGIENDNGPGGDREIDAASVALTGVALSGTVNGGTGGVPEGWTRIERRKQKKVKKWENKADVCVSPLNSLLLRYLSFLFVCPLSAVLGGGGEGCGSTGAGVIDWIVLATRFSAF